MATLTFDKLAYVDRLKAAGMGERERRALAEGLDQALREEVATKSDIAAVKTDLAAVKSELAADLAAVRVELKGDIAAVRTELRGDIAGGASLTSQPSGLNSKAISQRSSTTCCAGWSAWRSPRSASPWRSSGFCRTKRHHQRALAAQSSTLQR